MYVRIHSATTSNKGCLAIIAARLFSFPRQNWPRSSGEVARFNPEIKSRRAPVKENATAKPTMRKNTSISDGTQAARLRERCLIATVLESPGLPYPPFLRRAIMDYPELFQDPSCRILANAIKAASVNGTIPTEPTISEKLPAEKTDLIFSFHADHALPLSCIEEEAEKFLAGAKPQAIKTALGEAFEAVAANPENAESVSEHVRAALDSIASNGEQDSLTIRTPDELLAMTFDDSDRILGDGVLTSGQSLVICGQGGIGKSRIVLQMAVACRAGLPFISFETRGQDLRWLILQAENSNRRLNADLAALRSWIGKKLARSERRNCNSHSRNRCRRVFES